MSPSVVHVLDLSETQWSALEEINDRFEEAWSLGDPPAIMSHVPSDPGLRDAVLIELVHSDLEFRLAAGDEVRVEQYLERFPSLATDFEVVGGLIEAEWRARQAREPSLSIDEFLNRFPDHHDRIALWEARCCASRIPAIAQATRCSRAVCPPSRDRLGKFELLGEIGRGSFGVVHRARDTELDRLVALKVPRPCDLDLGDELDHLLREARAAAALKHPGIVTVYEAGRTDTNPFLAVELVEGPDLRSWLKTNRPERRQAVEMLALVADALEFAHRHGVIHRDLKPSNILLDADQKPHVSDFGLAKRDASDPMGPLDGQILGTPAYMSPEQARGEIDQIDARSDIYSLGVILYEMLTGQLPFQGLPRVVLHQVRQNEPVPPRRLDPTIPRPLERICLKAMAKEASHRYATAQDMAEDLRRTLDPEPSPTSGKDDHGFPVTSRTSTAAITATATVLVSLAVFASDRSATTPGDGDSQSPSQQQTTRHASGDSRGESREVAVSPDGRMVASFDGKSDLRLENLRTGVVQRIANHEAPILCMSFSPDSDQIASADENGVIRIFRTEDAREVAILRGHHLPVRDIAFTPDGQRLASVGDDRVVRIWDVASGQTLQTLSGHDERVGGVSFLGDGRFLITTSEQGTIHIWDSILGEMIHTLGGGDDTDWRFVPPESASAD